MKAELTPFKCLPNWNIHVAAARRKEPDAFDIRSYHSVFELAMGLLDHCSYSCVQWRSLVSVRSGDLLGPDPDSKVTNIQA